MSLNDVSDAFDGWEIPLIITRTTGEYVAGRWVDNVPKEINIEGVVQNATPEDLKVLPEAQRLEESIKIHTKTKLIPQIGTTTIGDTVNYENYDWLVYSVAHRTIGGYHKAIAMRQ